MLYALFALSVWILRFFGWGRGVGFCGRRSGLDRKYRPPDPKSEGQDSQEADDHGYGQGPVTLEGNPPEESDGDDNDGYTK